MVTAGAPVPKEQIGTVTDYLATPLQHTDAMFDYLYERPHAALLRQRLAARRPPGSG